MLKRVLSIYNVEERLDDVKYMRRLGSCNAQTCTGAVPGSDLGGRAECYLCICFLCLPQFLSTRSFKCAASVSSSVFVTQRSRSFYRIRRYVFLKPIVESAALNDYECIKNEISKHRLQKWNHSKFYKMCGGSLTNFLFQEVKK